MNWEAVFDWLATCWGCGALFLILGLASIRRKKPMHFWAGQAMELDSVRDVPAYNREYGKMWMRYSVPYWLAGLIGIFDFVSRWFLVAAVAVLLVGGLGGLIWMVRAYRRLEKTYVIGK